MLNFLQVVSVIVIGLCITLYLLLILGIISCLVSTSKDATANHQLLVLYITAIVITTIFCVPSIMLYRYTDKKLAKSKEN